MFSKKDVVRWADFFDDERRYYKEILQQLPVPVAVVDSHLRLISTNRSFRNYFEFTKNEAHGSLDASEELTIAAAKLFKERVRVDGIECEILGQRVTISAIPIYGCEDGEEAVLVIGTGAAAAAVAQEAPKLPVLVWEIGDSGERKILIAATEGMAGNIRTAWLAASEQADPFAAWLDQVHHEDRKRIRDFYTNLAALGGRASCEYRFQMGTAWLLLRDAVEANGTKRTGITTDLTRHFQGLQPGLETMRREAAGRLARSATHELNNTLMIIQGFAEELELVFAENDTHRQDALELIRASERATAIVARMQSVYRPVVGKTERFDLHSLIETVHASLGALAPRIKLELTAGNPQVDFDPKQLALCLKTFLEDAAKKLSAEKIELTTRVIIWRSSLAFPGAPAPGDFIAVRITTAPALTPSNPLTALEFSPEVSAVHAMSVAAGGCCWLSSPWDQQSLFNLWLPALSTQVVETPKIEIAESVTVLLVDDEEGIRALVRRILERQGFTVLDAASGDEALGVVRVKQGKIGLMITDWFMPGMNGRELAEKVREQLPKLPILLVSGYIDDPEIQAGTLPANTRFLAKPFSLPSLLEAVEALLRESTGG